MSEISWLCESISPDEKQIRLISSSIPCFSSGNRICVNGSLLILVLQVSYPGYKRPPDPPTQRSPPPPPAAEQGLPTHRVHFSSFPASIKLSGMYTYMYCTTELTVRKEIILKGMTCGMIFPSLICKHVRTVSSVIGKERNNTQGKDMWTDFSIVHICKYVQFQALSVKKEIIIKEMTSALSLSQTLV